MGRIVVFLHSNMRSGANLVMLRHAAWLAARGEDVHVVFQHEWFGKELGHLQGTKAPMSWTLAEYQAAGLAPAAVAITNWWQCVYDFAEIPARAYACYRHGDERALYASRAFDALIGMLAQEDLAWLVVNEHLAAELREAGHAPLVLPPGVEVAAFESASPRLPPRRKAIRILVEGPVGTPHKRVPETIAALRTLPEVEVVHMAADGSRAEGVDHGLGAVPHAEVPGVFASCDLVVKLSSLEAFSMPVLEQFAAGGTAIVSAFPGHETIVAHGRNALVCDLHDPFPDARDWLQHLVRNPTALQALRRAARETARNFDWQPLHRAFAAFLLEVSRKPRPGKRLPVVTTYRPCFAETLRLWALNEQGRFAAQ